MYDSLKQDPRWYCRAELVEDCRLHHKRRLLQSRCGCCESRHFRPSSKGVGQCTIECGCCSDYRGFETTSAEREKVLKQLQNMLESCNPAYCKDDRSLFLETERRNRNRRAEAALGQDHEVIWVERRIRNKCLPCYRVSNWREEFCRETGLLGDYLLSWGGEEGA